MNTCFRISLKSSPPGKKSRTMYRFFVSWSDSWMLQQKSAYLNLDRMSLSFRMCWICFLPRIFSFVRHFRAKYYLDLLCSTNFTCPKEPAPKCLIILNSFIWNFFFFVSSSSFSSSTAGFVSDSCYSTSSLDLLFLPGASPLCTARPLLSVLWLPSPLRSSVYRYIPDATSLSFDVYIFLFEAVSCFETICTCFERNGVAIYCYCFNDAL